MNTLALFFVVSLASTAMPGPAVLYVASQGVAGGMRSGLPAAVGVLSADAVYIVLSVTGLSAILAASYELFTLMKWAGTVYLLYLGMQLLRSAFSKSIAVASPATPVAVSRSLIGGFVLHAANPKALLYFGSLVPQFVDPTRSLATQLSVLALVHLSTAAVVLFVYAALSSHFRNSAVTGSANRVFTVVAGSSLIGAGLSMAFLRRGAE